MIVSSLQTLKSVGCVFVLFLSVYIQYCKIVFSLQTLKRVGCVGVFFVCIQYLHCRTRFVCFSKRPEKGEEN